MKTELFTPAELADMVDTLAQIKAEEPTYTLRITARKVKL